MVVDPFPLSSFQQGFAVQQVAGAVGLGGTVAEGGPAGGTGTATTAAGDKNQYHVVSLGHIVDAERIIAYRALAIARGDTQPLPGFDENSYVQNASFDHWKLGDLAEEYALVRRSNIVFFQNLPAEAWDRRGTANGHPVSVRGLAYVIVGHERHHLKVLRDKYKVS